MKRGRPSRSIVREHLKEILFLGGTMTAYEAHKHYIQLFAATTQRNVYYQLEKGVANNFFEVDQIKDEEGHYSWGGTARKTYYRLAKNIKPNFTKEVHKYFQELEMNKVVIGQMTKDGISK